MNISVEQIKCTSTMRSNGEFRCTHEDIDVVTACCTTTGESGLIECGCAGQDSFYCNNCDNEDMTENDVEDLRELL